MHVCAIASLGTPRARKQPRILIVEDDIDSWNLIQMAVREAIPDALIQWASDAASARLALESCRFDAVLADYMLEDESNGWNGAHRGPQAPAGCARRNDVGHADPAAARREALPVPAQAVRDQQLRRFRETTADVAAREHLSGAGYRAIGSRRDDDVSTSAPSCCSAYSESVPAQRSIAATSPASAARSMHRAELGHARESIAGSGSLHLVRALARVREIARARGGQQRRRIRAAVLEVSLGQIGELGGNLRSRVGAALRRGSLGARESGTSAAPRTVRAA